MAAVFRKASTLAPFNSGLESKDRIFGPLVCLYKNNKNVLFKICLAIPGLLLTPFILLEELIRFSTGKYVDIYSWFVSNKYWDELDSLLNDHSEFPTNRELQIAHIQQKVKIVACLLRILVIQRLKDGLDLD